MIEKGPLEYLYSISLYVVSACVAISANIAGPYVTIIPQDITYIRRVRDMLCMCVDTLPLAIGSLTLEFVGTVIIMLSTWLLSTFIMLF
jgi:hypothetical protein